jgi:hypothetical protein
MLEPGRRHRYFPQSYFPFTSPLDITDLQDRLYSRHESFALCSMHAHLPIPFEVNLAKESNDEQTGSQDPSQRAGPVKVEGKAHADLEHTPHGHSISKRPMFDLGIYERPNALSLQGVEPGTIGMRNYLELPVADGLITHGKEEHGGRDSDIGSEHAGGLNIEKLSATEAFNYLAHDEGMSIKIGKHAPTQDRIELLKTGPKAWKRIGVRGITMKAITQRLEEVDRIRNIVVEKGWSYTLLDMYGAEALGQELFSKFLWPAARSKTTGAGAESDLKVQIEALVKVLTTPGAWLDFSLPSERLLFVQNVHTREVKEEDVHGITAQEKRRWNLIQLVLAIELVIRLDAALRKGIAVHSKDFPISNEEIRHFNQLRNLKVDWDLVVARRFLDLSYAKCITTEHSPTGLDSGPKSPDPEGGKRWFGKMKHTLSFKQGDLGDPDNTGWDVAILPLQPKIMIDGLLRFASDIGWSAGCVEILRQSFIDKLHNKPAEEKFNLLTKGVEAVVHPHVPQHAMDKSVVELRQASSNTLGGPLSHAWLGGLIIPGHITCDLLMATLLEQDPEALLILGNMAHIRSGFVLKGKSYWSKLMICGTVLAAMPGAREAPGWISLPQSAGPVDEELNSVSDGWKVVVCQPVPKQREGDRIFDGEAMAKESSPLGIGKGRVHSREFNMVTDKVLDDATKANGEVQAQNIELLLQPVKDGKADEEEYHAGVSFQASHAGGEAKQRRLRLRYKANFIGAHPCRPPHGHLGNSRPSSPSPSTPGAADVLGRQVSRMSLESESMSATSATDSPSSERPHFLQHHSSHRHPHLPAHPLHQSFKYTPKSLAELLTLGPNDWLPTPVDKEAGHVWVVDARGSWERDVVARAWCSWVGRDAIVSRVGKCCMGCAIREAKALEIGIVIRVGAIEGQ